MSFFIRKAGNKPLKRAKGGKRDGPVPTKKAKGKGEEILSDESDLETEDKRKRPETPDSEEEAETAQEKRIRLAKKVLEEIEKQERERNDDREFDVSGLVGKRLREDALEQAGKLRRTVADTLQVDHEKTFFLKCKDHKLSVTCAVASSEGNYAFSASKDCSIVKWSLLERRKVGCIKGGKKAGKHGHTMAVQSIAISSDNKYLATGCEGKLINIWNAADLSYVHTFRGHREGVTSLVFRKGTNTLFSSSKDKSVKVWNLDEMAYVETLFGHTDSITCVDALTRERALTSGGRDGTLRLWKIVEESQLIYNGHTGSIDCVRFINDEHFVSCGDDGNLSLWGTMKKKPFFTLPKAHGEVDDSKAARWISAVAAFQNTDLIASGSHDGNIKLWKCGEAFRNLRPVESIPLKGFVNGLHFSSEGNVLVAAVGQEHRLGRWWREKEAHNGIMCVSLKKKS